jgi:hypothetical protein
MVHYHWYILGFSHDHRLFFHLMGHLVGENDHGIHMANFAGYAYFRAGEDPQVDAQLCRFVQILPFKTVHSAE